MSTTVSEITKEEFIQVCEESKSKIEAYKRLGMHRNTFEKYLKLFGVEFTKKSIKRKTNMILKIY